MLVAANRTFEITEEVLKRLSALPLVFRRGAAGVAPRLREAACDGRIFGDGFRASAYIFARHLERVRLNHEPGLPVLADDLVPRLDSLVAPSWRVRRYWLDEPTWSHLHDYIHVALEKAAPRRSAGWLFQQSADASEKGSAEA